MIVWLAQFLGSMFLVAAAFAVSFPLGLAAAGVLLLVVGVIAEVANGNRRQPSP